MSDMTIAKALQQRKTIANKLATYAQRAMKCALKEKDQETDFDTESCLEQFESEQFALRDMKIKGTLASHQTLVPIPKEVPVPEAGTTIPVYQAVLIRDDLKGRKALLEQLVNLPTVKSNYMRGVSEEVKLERTFDFEKILEEISIIQDAIDQVDALVQYTDNTTKI
jgi:ribosomal protein S18